MLKLYEIKSGKLTQSLNITRTTGTCIVDNIASSFNIMMNNRVDKFTNDLNFS